MEATKGPNRIERGFEETGAGQISETRTARLLGFNCQFGNAVNLRQVRCSQMSRRGSKYFVHLLWPARADRQLNDPKKPMETRLFGLQWPYCGSETHTTRIPAHRCRPAADIFNFTDQIGHYNIALCESEPQNPRVN